MSNDIAVSGQVYDLAVARDPKQVLEEARSAAKALKEVVSQKDKPVMFNGEQYLEYEDWQTVGKFYGVTAKVTNTAFVDYGGAKGFEAHAEAILINTGMVISAADSMCLNDEDKWTARAKYEYPNGVKTKVGEVPVPMFQLRSMAQTRACAKALRNVLSWVVVLAGYAPTPAEDMTGDEQPGKPAPKKQGMPESKSAAAGKALIMKGAILEYKLPTGKGPFRFTVNDTEFSLFPLGKGGVDNTDTIETLKRNSANMDTIEVHYHVEESADKRFKNNMVDKVFTIQGEKKEQPGA